jgi:methanogenic corrinoid protein MtbC1
MVASAQRAVPQTIGENEVAQPMRRRQATDRSGVQDRLAHAIEAQVVPRLLLSRLHGQVCGDYGLLAGAGPKEAEVVTLAERLLVDDVAGAHAMIEAMFARGATHEEIFLELFAPTARLLGLWWEEDRCDFGIVTLGLLRLRQFLRTYGASFEAAAPLRDPRRRIVIASPPDEQHSFGRDMLAAFFRRAGWDVWECPPQAVGDIAALVRREWFALVGISASGADRIDGIATTIRSIRSASRNSGIGIMVGGPVFSRHPDCVALVGADATAIDGKQATLQAERLLDLLARRD